MTTAGIVIGRNNALEREGGGGAGGGSALGLGCRAGGTGLLLLFLAAHDATSNSTRISA